GIPRMAYKATTGEFQPCRSDTCGHCSSLSTSIALIQSSFFPGRSRDTPKTVKFLSLNFSYAATTVGFSRRQGPHQLAQKSTSTYLPLNEESAKSFPAVSGKVKSGARVPMASFSRPVILSLRSLPKSVAFKLLDKLSNAGFKAVTFSGFSSSFTITRET